MKNIFKISLSIFLLTILGLTLLNPVQAKYSYGHHGNNNHYYLPYFVTDRIDDMATSTETSTEDTNVATSTPTTTNTISNLSHSNNNFFSNIRSIRIPSLFQIITRLRARIK